MTSCCSDENAKYDDLCYSFLSLISLAWLATILATIRARDDVWNATYSATYYTCSTLMVVSIYAYDRSPENGKRDWLKVPIFFFSTASNSLLVYGASELFTGHPVMALFVWSLVVSASLLNFYSFFISPRDQSTDHHYESLPVQVRPMITCNCKLEIVAVQ